MSSKKSTQEILKEAIAFTDDKEKLHFEAEMLHLDIMFQIETLMKRYALNKTELALKMNVTKSYLTQLFTGDKLINLKTLAKLQRIFGLKFSFSVDANDDLQLDQQKNKSQIVAYENSDNNCQKRKNQQTPAC